MKTVLSVENLSKSYKLGQIGTGTFSRDIEMWWARRRGKPNPFLKIGQTDDASLEGETLWALRDVSFEVQQGEVLGIIGRNGAGKSTLLKILSRVTAPTSGLVKVKGRIASLLEVGTGFHPELTGRENIYLNGAILGMSRQEVTRKFDEIVAFAEVEKFIDTPVKRYSSGMYVRLAFAVAAHLESEILLVDEVLAVGDAEFQKKCLGKMGDVASQEGRTVLFVSHNMGAVRNLCHQVFILAKGKIVLNGETTDVTSFYLRNSISAKNFNESTDVDCKKLSHSGSGEAKISWAKIRNSKDEPTLHFEMDEEIKITFGIENPHELKLNYAVEILDQNDYPLFHFESEYEPTEQKPAPITNSTPEVVIIMPPLYLFPDEYYINLWAGLHHSRVDKVEKCFQIRTIMKSSIHRTLLTTRGRYFKEGNWVIK